MEQPSDYLTRKQFVVALMEWQTQFLAELAIRHGQVLSEIDSRLAHISAPPTPRYRGNVTMRDVLKRIGKSGDKAASGFLESVMNQWAVDNSVVFEKTGGEGKQYTYYTPEAADFAVEKYEMFFNRRS